MSSNSVLKSKYPHGIQIRGDIQSIFDDHSAKFYGEESFELKELSNTDINLLKILKSGATWDKIKSTVKTKREVQLIYLLDSKSALKSVPNDADSAPKLSRQIDWLSYFHADPNHTQDIIKQKKVLIVGCGGTGCIIAEHLIRSGVSHFILIDPAKTDAPDMNRQLSYVPSDIGQYKTHALEKRLREIEENVDVTILTQGIYNKEELEHILNAHRPDLLINCADNPVGLIQSIICEGSLATNTPVLFGGVGLKEASIGPLLINSEQKSHYGASMKRIHERFNKNEKPIKASIAFTNTWTSSMIAFEAFKFLSQTDQCMTIGKSMLLNFMTGSLSVEKTWKGEAQHV